MATKLGIFNGALAALGQRELQSLTDPTEPRRVLERLWDNGFVDGLLEQGEWNFAVRTVKSTQDPPPPAFGFQFRHAKPGDWRRTVKISDQPTFKPQLDNYSDEGNYLYCNAEELYLQYISNHPSYGGNMAAWPKTFARYAELELAIQAAPRVLPAQESEAKLKGPQGLLERTQQALRNAKSKDASNQPPEFPPMGTWARSRWGGWFPSDTNR